MKDSLKAEIKAGGVEKYVGKEIDYIKASADGLADAGIEDAEDYAAVCGLLLDVVEKKKAVEEEKDKVLAPAKVIVDTVRGWFAPLEAAIADHEKRIKGLVREYAVKGEQIRALRLRQAGSLAKADPIQARALVASANYMLAPKVNGISVTGKITFDVIDESKVPDQFFIRVINEKAIAAAVEAGEDVPGILVKDERTVRVTPSQRGA